MSRERSINHAFGRDRNEKPTPFGGHRRNVLGAFAGLVLLGGATGVGVHIYIENHIASAKSAVKKAVDPKLVALQRDVIRTDKDIAAKSRLGAVHGQNTTKTGLPVFITPKSVEDKYNHMISADYARDQRAYRTFSLAVGHEEGQPYSQAILANAQNAAYKAEDALPGASTSLSLGSG